jgi:hypothetical protein
MWIYIYIVYVYMGSTGSRQGSFAGFYEHGKELPDSIQDKEHSWIAEWLLASYEWYCSNRVS